MSSPNFAIRHVGMNSTWTGAVGSARNEWSAESEANITYDAHAVNDVEARNEPNATWSGRYEYWGTNVNQRY